MTYHVDRFFAAVSVLAAHGHIKQRLIQAYEDNLTEVSESDLPITAREAFADLKSRMYRFAPLNGEGPICASVRKMSVEEAGACAVSVVELYREVLRSWDAGSQSAVGLDTDERPGVPPFLVKTN